MSESEAVSLLRKQIILLKWMLCVGVAAFLLAGTLAYSSVHSKTDFEKRLERLEQGHDNIRKWISGAMDMMSAHGWDK